MTMFSNSSEPQLEESESYTLVSSLTLLPLFPGAMPVVDDVVRERPSALPRERTPEEMALLRRHPLFADESH